MTRSWMPERLRELRATPSPPGVHLGLLFATIALLQTGTPRPPVVVALIAVGIVAFASLRWRVGAIAAVALLGVGVGLRIDAIGVGFSDVLTVTRAAIDLMLAGGNPYGHGFGQSQPPGAPFAYGPLALLWYLPVRERPVDLELLVSLALLVVLALRGRMLGLAIYSVTPALIVTASDGSNDTSAGLLLLVALLLAERHPLAGGFALAVAAAFKPYALAWLPPLVAYGGLMPLISFVAGTALLWGPAIVLWGPDAIVRSFREADSLHRTPYYSLAYGLGEHVHLPEAAWQLVRYLCGLALAATSWLFIRSARSFVLMGAAIFLATLFLGWWSTFAYVAAIAPILCWRLDDWLGLRPIGWPGDPVEGVSAAVDRRWPILRPWDAARATAGRWGVGT